MAAVLQLSIRDVALHAAEELSAREARIAQELIERAWARMPKVADFVTQEHVAKFFDLACSVHELPPIGGEVASIKDCEAWFSELCFESHIALPELGYRACAYRVMRHVFCFSKHDLVDLDVGFYKALMAFVRPMRDAVVEYNTTH